MQTLLAFFVLLGVLITVHELGHFLVAKAAGVRVLTFSIGFGPKLVGFTRGETEYRISAIPLGGYVRMYGDDITAEVPPEERRYAFLEQRYPVKMAIAAAGPAANILLPLAIFFGLAIGEEKVADAVVGTVLPEQPAAAAGLLPGDRFIAIEGEPVAVFSDVQERVGPRAGQPTAVTVRGTDGTERTLTVVPAAAPNPDPLDDKPVGRLGILSSKMLPVIAVAEGSLAAQAGLVSGDRVRSVDGQAIDDRDALFAALHTARARLGQGGGAVSLVVERRVQPPKPAVVTVPPGAQAATPAAAPATVPEPAPAASATPSPAASAAGDGKGPLQTLTLTLAIPAAAADADADGADGADAADTMDAADADALAPEALRFAVTTDELKGDVEAARADTARRVAEAAAAQATLWGIATMEGVLGVVQPDTPAAARGLKPRGHRVVALNGRALGYASELYGPLQQAPDAIHHVGLVDEMGRGVVLSLRLQKSKDRSMGGMKVLGVVPLSVAGESPMVTRQVGPGEAAARAVRDTGRAVGAVVGGFGALFSGKASLDQIGGPVMIATIAGEAAQSGLVAFLGLMCLISVNLAILNLLPVPVLDGGHILLFTVEAVRRKKLSVASRIKVTKVGLVMVGLLMAVALFNDCASLF